MKRRFLGSVWLVLLLSSGSLMAQSTIEKTGKKVETGAKKTGEATAEGAKKVAKGDQRSREGNC